MDDERFLRAVEVVLRHEGGYVHDPSDPGGETKYGISKRSYPHLDIAGLTRDDAIAIYRRDWWDRYGYGRIDNNGVAAKVLDLSVNVGPHIAHTLLQRALHAAGQRHVTIDGLIGPQTLTAANAADPAVVLGALRAEAAWYYRRLVEGRPDLERFRTGWLNRAYA